MFENPGGTRPPCPPLPTPMSVADFFTIYVIITSYTKFALIGWNVNFCVAN